MSGWFLIIFLTVIVLGYRLGWIIGSFQIWMRRRRRG